jgi:hypothetical protein
MAMAFFWEELPSGEGKMGISVSGKQQYEKCQRAFFHERVMKHEHDADFVTPLYFNFGRAAHACLEAFGYDCKAMKTETIFAICKENGIENEYDAARVGVAVRTYFAHWPSTKVMSVEGWLETEFFHGRYDAITKDERGYWILENKFHSQISRDLGVELTGDLQLCSYATEAKSIAEKLNLDGPLIGAKYRVTTKNSQTIGGKRSQYDGPLDFLKRGKNGHALELEMLFEEMNIGVVKMEMRMTCAEIDLKGDTEALFEQNLEQCVWNQKKDEACPFFSRCHDGKTYSESLKGAS